MADKKNSGDALDVDDLLAFAGGESETSTPDAAEESTEAPAETKTVKDEPEAETDIQRRLREAREELEKPIPAEAVRKAARPTPEALLSPEEKELRLLEDRLAKKRALEAEVADDALETADGAEKTILIHFIINGFTAQSRTWQRGQEMEFVVGGRAYEQTMDRFGKSWLDLRNDPVGQIERYGAEYFREGPYNGLPIGYTQDLSDPEDIAALQKIAAEEAKRNRAAPIIG